MATTEKRVKKPKKNNGDGHISLRKDGRWGAVISVDGKPKYLYGKTQAEVKRNLKDYKQFIAKGYKDVKKIKLNVYMENWILSTYLGTVSSSTFDRYESTFKHHIKDTIGELQMGNITTEDIRQLINNKAMGYNDETPLAISSIKKILELLNPCFRYAVSVGDLNVNPCDNVKLPKVENIVVQTKEFTALTEDEVKMIKEISSMKRINGSPYYRYAWLYVFMLNTGLRIGEMIGLKWSDVDFEERIVSINKAIKSSVKIRDINNVPTGKRKNVESTTKNKKGRTVKLNDTAINCLYELKNYMEQKSIKTQYVAYTDEGTRATARNLQRTLDSVLKKAGIPHYSLHELRHTFGTILLKKGVDISVVSKLMGHANTSITYKHYIHVIDEQKVKALDLLDLV